jgi:hypothetical protein
MESLDHNGKYEKLDMNGGSSKIGEEGHNGRSAGITR